MTTFALVHGAWHGAWCWEKLTPELQALGHRVITMDLPCDDGGATFDDYADLVCAAISDAGDDVVLVGHSLGGLTVARVAARRPLRHLVYLCAMPPVPGQAFSQQMSEDTEMLLPDYLAGISDLDVEGRTRWIDQGVATRVLFGDCDEASAATAFARLRWQGTRGYEVAYQPASLPRVDTTYVVCTEDGILNPEWSRRIARERLDAELIEMPGSHSPFVSRPQELAAVLHRVSG
jgi:pimeloyl-ACP methyl ester carboxylesterase